MTWEFRVLDYIAGFHSEILNKIMIYISALNDNGYVWIAVAIILLCSKKYRIIGFGCALALIIMQISGNMIIKPIVDRPRPYELRNIALLIDKPSGSSFPSGHTYSSFACATVIYLFNKRAGLSAFILAVLIAFSRMYLYVHFPTDVIGAMIFGVIDGIICYFIVIKLNKKLDKSN